jgi:diguanylate cyclase (GGDEF)-like protein
MLNQADHLVLTPTLLSRPTIVTDDSGAMEAEFRRHFVERLLPFARASLGLGLVLVVAVCILDMLLMPRASYEPAIPLRIVGMFIPLATALSAALLLRERSWLPYLFVAVAIIVGVAAQWIDMLAAGTELRGVSWGVFYVTFNSYVLMALTLRQSVAVGVTLFVVYLVFGIVTGVPLQQLSYGILFLGAANLVGAWACFILERSAREVFDGKRELVRLAHTDGLTELFNRRTFDQHLRQVWKQAQREQHRIAVVVADIDHFKLYNDCYGHREGDACIKAVAAVLAASVSRPLDIVARYGGEEYVVVLYDPSREFLDQFVHGLCQSVVDLGIEHKGSETTHTVSLSIGAAITEASANITADQLIRQADDALYEAKNLGRNRAVVYRTEWGQQTTANLAAILI